MFWRGLAIGPVIGGEIDEERSRAEDRAALESAAGREMPVYHHVKTEEIDHADEAIAEPVNRLAARHNFAIARRIGRREHRLASTSAKQKHEPGNSGEEDEFFAEGIESRDNRN